MKTFYVVRMAMRCYYSLLLAVVVCLYQVLPATSLCVCHNKSSVHLQEEDCVCLVTNSCMPSWKNWLSSSSNADHKSLEAIFNPFVKYKDSVGPVAHINVTVTLKNTGVKGLAFWYSARCFNDLKERCRFYDFRNARDLAVGTVFYNDLVYFDPQVADHACNIGVIGVSQLNTVLYYNMFLIKVPNRRKLEEEKTLKNWEAFIVLETNDQLRSVKVFFIPTPPQLNVSTYNMRIVENDVALPWKPIEYHGGPVISKEISNLYLNVNYTVEISVIDDVTSTSAAFMFTGDDLVWLKIVCGLLLVILLIVFMIVMWIKTSHKNWLKRLMESSFEVKVFLVYSHDIKEHIDVVHLLAKYLNTYCHCSVILDTIDLRNQDPHFWVSESISSADFVLIIWSRGAHLKVAKGNTKILKNEPGYLGENLFSNAIIKISAKISQALNMPYHQRNLHKFINISLSYVPKDCVPSELDYLSHYRLPNEFNALLYCLHGFAPAQPSFSLLPSRACLPCWRCYPLLPFSKLKKLPEGQKLLMAIDEMHKVEKRGDWLEERLKIIEPPPGHQVSPATSSDSESEEDEMKRSCQEFDIQKNCINDKFAILHLSDTHLDLPAEIFGPDDTPDEMCNEISNSDDIDEELPDEIFGP